MISEVVNKKYVNGIDLKEIMSKWGGKVPSCSSTSVVGSIGLPSSIGIM